MSKQNKNDTVLCNVVGIDKDKCLNCHACIAVCPVKYCNDGSGEHVRVNNDLCIGCGSCLKICSHDARYPIDDFDSFIYDLKKGDKIIAIVAPSVASNFPQEYYQLNGWLQSLGIKTVFDVSFGAELCVKSYVDYIKENPNKTVICQPCPAIVSYIEIYQPELLDYLAPINSPMLHTMKMIKAYYKKYSGYKIAAISPCMAKKREFNSTGFGHYNVGFLSILKYIKNNNINLSDYPSIQYENPFPERAVLFPNPGGLSETLARWMPNIRVGIRKIEGTESVYAYLKSLTKLVNTDKAPLVVDCLNCELGCNGGTLSVRQDQSPDENEYWVNKRLEEIRQNYIEGNQLDLIKIEKVLSDFWEKNLYLRTYDDHNYLNFINIPSADKQKELFARMHKYTDADIKNCSSCGYFACEDMATAIYNQVNRPENCHFYLSKENDLSHQRILAGETQFRTILETSVEGFLQVDNDFKIVRVNPSMCKILLREERALLGKKIRDFIKKEMNDIINKQHKIRDKGKKSTYQLKLIKGDGTEALCQFYSSPLYNEQNIKIGSFSMVNDITKYQEVLEELDQTNKELEERVRQRTNKLIRSEKMASIGHLVAGVAHEVNNPLAFIKANTCFIEEDLEKIKALIGKDLSQMAIFDGLKSMITINVEGLNRISKITKTLKRFSRPSSDDKILGDINIGIQDTLLLVSKNLKDQVEIKEDYSKLPLIPCDMSQLNQVFMNIIINAAQAKNVTAINIRTWVYQSYIFIEIADNGNGIPQDIVNNIFDPFFTTKDEGSGLGLSISYHIIQDHKGDIYVKSKEKEGTTMLIRFPIEDLTQANNNSQVQDQETE